MGFARALRVVIAAAVVLAAGEARADYDTNPALKPQTRCAAIPAGIGDPSDAAGAQSIHCQKLFWDLPNAKFVGQVGIAAPFEEDRPPRFPNGVTDRPPPLFVDAAGNGYEQSGANRTALCPNAGDIPYWEEVLNADGSPVIATDTDFGVHQVGSASAPVTGPKFVVACQPGSRSYFGPWQTGGTVDPAECKAACAADPGKCHGGILPDVCTAGPFDRLTATKAIRFENTQRLNDDVAPGAPRVEWNIGTEFYNHFGSHHGTCFQPTNPTCADPAHPAPAEAYQPGGACESYEHAADPDSNCSAATADPSCGSDKPSMGGFRNATQIPGRLSVPIPDGRGVLGTEDQLWGCNHHVVLQLPPGSYGINHLVDYRLQTGGLTNTTSHTIYDVPPTQVIGGTVGEMVVNYFSRPATDKSVKPVSVVFNALADAATTYYPPFTWNYHQSAWQPPYDAAIGLTAIHSHHRMVKGTMAVVPPSLPRLSSPNADCGGWGSGKTPTDIYTDWTWEDAPVCQYWKEPDGPVTIRKGEALTTTCYVNNGVTPEAIKHGLVAGASVEALKALGAPIPDYPQLMPASTWGDALVSSPVGQDLLYGTHPPINYRVVYKCSTLAPTVPGATLLVTPENAGDTYSICSPNPAVDADGDYIDGAYVNETQCGAGGLCQPGSIVFACVGEDEMCIGVAMYWALERVLNSDGTPNQDALGKLQAGKINEVGTPGVLVPTDVGVGNCPDCQPGL